MNTKKIIYIDMDNVLVDFPSGVACLGVETQKEYENRLDDVPGIFSLMKPMKGSIESFNKLAKIYDVYVLSTAPWDNPTAWSEKLDWIKKYLPDVAYKRLILSHHKNLNRGDFLIDDRTKNGAEEFEGELILFGSEKFPDWESVCEYLTQE